MATLKSILDQLNLNETQQKGIIQLFVFNKLFYELSEKEKDKLQEKDNNYFEISLLLQSQIPQAWRNLPTQLVSTSPLINELLTHDFDESDKTLYLFIQAMIQLRMFDDYDKSLGKHNRLEERAYIKAEEHHRNILKNLQLFNEQRWPFKQGKFRYALLIGLTEVSVKKRLYTFLSILQHHRADEVTLFYMGNARYLLNNEKSLPVILANAFGDHELTKPINEVLTSDDNKDYAWFKGNLKELKKKVLAKVREVKKDPTIQWPTKPTCSYSESMDLDKSGFPKVYHEVMQAMDKEPLDYYWPTEIEMVNHLLNNFRRYYNGLEEGKVKINIEPVLVVGRHSDTGFRLSTAEEMLNVFCQKHRSTVGEEIFPVIADNSVSYNFRQGEIAKHELSQKGINCIPICDGFNEYEINMQTAGEQFAKWFYRQGQMIEFSEENRSEIQNSASFN